MAINKETGCYILDTGSGIRCYTNDSECRSGCFTRNYIHRHESAEETNQHANSYSKKNHSQYVYP